MQCAKILTSACNLDFIKVIKVITKKRVHGAVLTLSGVLSTRVSLALTMGGVRMSWTSSTMGLAAIRACGAGGASSAVAEISWLATSLSDSPMGDAPVGAVGAEGEEGDDGDEGADGDDSAEGAVTGSDFRASAAGSGSAGASPSDDGCCCCWSLCNASRVLASSEAGRGEYCNLVPCSCSRSR